MGVFIRKDHGGLIELNLCENGGNNTGSVVAVFRDVQFDDGMVGEDTIVNGGGRIVFEGGGSGGRKDSHCRATKTRGYVGSSTNAYVECVSCLFKTVG
jgi:hypothetical protein